MGDGQEQDLGWVVKNGDLAEIKSKVEKDSSLVKKDCSGRPPLCIAADYGQTDIIEYLIGKGADVNKPDKYGISPLLSAVFEGHTGAVQLLLKKGADKSGKTPDGQSYKDVAETDAIKLLLA